MTDFNDFDTPPTYERLTAMFEEATTSLAGCIAENEQLHRKVEALEEQLQETEIQRDEARGALIDLERQ